MYACITFETITLQMLYHFSPTWAPWCLSRSQMGRCGGWSWNHRRKGFHRCPRPEQLAPAACCPELARYSWDMRCSCAVRSPSPWKSLGAGERWTGSRRCPYKGFLGNSTAVIHRCESMAAVCYWHDITGLIIQLSNQRIWWWEKTD